MYDQDHTLVFFVNGKKVEDSNVDPEWTLAYYLRRKLRLCGTKLGCGEGGCGICTVMVSKYDRGNNKEIHIPVMACLAPVCSMHGLSVTTIEGIGSCRTRLHPLQDTIAKAHGTQCGFCTPGIVMSMYTLLRQNNSPTMKDMAEALQGNLCRCVGYGPIIEGYKSFCKNCPCKGGKPEIENKEEQLFKPEEFIPFDPSQEPIFPPELKLSAKYDKQSLKIQGSRVTWYRPTTLQELLELKSMYPKAAIIVGNTEVGVEIKFKNKFYSVFIQPTQIADMTGITETTEGVMIGASVSLADIKDFLKGQIRRHPETKTRIFQAVNKLLIRFAVKQIRSVGSLAGSIIGASPISDMVPILMACKAILEVQGKNNGTRRLPLDNKFYTGYKTTIMDPEEVIVSILLPFSNKNQYFAVYKQSRRREDDMAIVNMSINVQFEENNNNIVDISFGIGGMHFTTVDAPKTQNKLKGLPWTKATLEQAYPCLLEDLPLNPDAPGGMTQYRQTLALSLFLKGFLLISEQLQRAGGPANVEQTELSGSYGFWHKDYQSSQHYTVVPGTQQKEDSVQRPMVHESAFKHATGEAVYVDDMPCYQNELYMAFVLSTKAHANIVFIDTEEALKMEGVVGFLSDKDLTEEQNSISLPEEGDEKVFYSKKVFCVGLPMGAIVAESQTVAQRAAKAVKVTYEELQPIIVTMEDAIERGSFFPEKDISTLDYGTVDESLTKAKHTVKGSCRTGNQKNFYLETQGLLCVPRDGGEMDIYSSTQRPMELHTYAAKLLGISINKISVKVKRLGGAFGGKQWRSIIIALPVVLAAYKFQQPVRYILDRDEDMMIVGGRAPCLVEYNVGFDDGGKIEAADFKVYSNAGYSVKGVPNVDWKVSIHLDNAFKIPNFRAKGRVCRTNIPGNNPTRGFGRPEGIFLSLFMIEDIAEYLKKDFVDICRVNLYKEGDETHYKQKVDASLEKSFDECLKLADYFERKKTVEKFNRENRYKKRGLAIIPAKYGIGREPVNNWMAQAAALIMVYLDGSVLLHHGGVEMGQGLHTKMIQIATRLLEIPAEKIYVDANDTNIVPNCNATNSSLSSDLFGPAVIDACTQIKERLKPYKDANPNGSWEDWINDAYVDKVSLSATGFFGHPDNEFDAKTKTGRLFDYFVCGSGCSEVEVDTLTGDHQLLRTDIVMDLGESLNPAIDIGQIEGAFMFGYGLFVMEEVVYDTQGRLFTTGPATYKIPAFVDIPRKFNVSLLKGSSNPRAVFSSKAVGEPPLGLAGSVFFAIKDAIRAARRETGASTSFRLDSPATVEKIRMACIDNITEKVSEKIIP